MQTHAENNKGPQSADRAQTKQANNAAMQFADHRPEVMVQRKLQEAANDSPHARNIAQFQKIASDYSSRQHFPVQKKENKTGLPDNLKSGVENLSGYSMDDVKVHYNSDKPAQLQAHAYAQGTAIHIGPGQEQHLPHEAWHVVQQKQGRVNATTQLMGNIPVNDNTGLESEADVMGAKAATLDTQNSGENHQAHFSGNVVQRKIGFEYELDSIRTRKTDSYYLNPMKTWTNHEIGERIVRKTGYDITADMGVSETRLEFITNAFDEEDELPELIQVIQNILLDIEAIKTASLVNKKGYLAGTRVGGRDGWFAGEGWVGADAIPRIGGPWWHQLQYAASARAQLVGQLQMTAGLTLDGLQDVTAAESMGNARNWPGRFQNDHRQFMTSYARHEDAPPQLYQSALAAVREVNLCNRDNDAEKTFAGILAVMIQAPLSYRGVGYEGQLIAKTDYSKLLSLAVDQTGIFVDERLFLAALLSAINRNVDDDKQVDGGDPVFMSSPELDLGKVNFADWVGGLVPYQINHRRYNGIDRMTKKHYPGTQMEKGALRTFGPYEKRTDAGNKAIFEFRSLIKNPTGDLEVLVRALRNYIRYVNRP